MFLTDAEHRVVDLLGEAAGLFASSVCGTGATRAADLAEFVGRIHDLQHAVMSQAAARAHPELYRLLGETVDRVVGPPP